MKPVNDPALLERLNAPVTNPAALARLNGKPPEEDEQVKRIRQELDDEAGLLVQLGAGVDSVVKGAKQLFNVGPKRSDEEIEADRKFKEDLANKRWYGGAAQLAGEIGATGPIGLGVSGVAKVGAKVLGKALPRVAQVLQGGRGVTGTTAVRGATEGAAQGALSEVTEDESRGFNAALGGTVGAALPLAIAGGKKAWGVVSKKNAPNRAAKVFENQLGKDRVKEITENLDLPHNQSILPLSTAAKANDVELAALERGARTRGKDIEYSHDRPVAQAAWDTLKRATGNADELEQRIIDREDIMRASREMLDQSNNPTLVRRAANDVSDVVKDLRQTSTARQYPNITNEIGQVEAMLRHPDATAGDFAAQYWRLDKLIDSPNITVDEGNVLRKLQESIAQGADTAAGAPHFSDMLGMYKAEQGRVAQSEASKAMREVFQSPEGVIKTKNMFGTPEVTSDTLRSTMARHGENKYGSLIEDANRAELNALEKDLGRHELWKASRSPGNTKLEEGVNPVSALGSGANNPFNRVWAARGLSNALLGRSRKDMVEAADQALMSPDMWKKMMEDYAKSKSPLTPEEYAARWRRQLALMPGRIGAVEIGE